MNLEAEMSLEEQVEAAYEAAGWGGEEYRTQRPPLADHIRWLQKQIERQEELNSRLRAMLEGREITVSQDSTGMKVTYHHK